MFIKNSLKIFLLGIITPLLCGVSFATTNLDLLENYVISSGNHTFTNSNLNLGLGELNPSNSEIDYCISISGNRSTADKNNNFAVGFVSNGSTSVSVVVQYPRYFPNNTIVCSHGNKNSFIIKWNPGGSNPTEFNIDYKLYNFSAFLSATNNGGGSSSCDYSEYEATINTLSGSLATCNSNLNSCLNSNCDTQLNQCIIDRDNALSSVNTLSGSLASCNEDKTSLQNYNNSLNNQLNQCLLGGSGENLSGSCIDYSIFWTDSDTNYSLPITNNLFLPNGYKGKYNEDNVLSIAKINTLEAAYQFSEEDKITIIDILSIVMLFLLATGSLIGLIVFLKRLVINRK